MIDPYAAGLAGTARHSYSWRKRTAVQLPCDSTGGRELAVDPQLSGSVGQLGSGPEMMLA
jgi:hypothetical protein